MTPREIADVAKQRKANCSAEPYAWFQVKTRRVCGKLIWHCATLRFQCIRHSLFPPQLDAFSCNFICGMLKVNTTVSSIMLWLVPLRNLKRKESARGDKCWGRSMCLLSFSPSRFEFENSDLHMQTVSRMHRIKAWTNVFRWEKPLRLKTQLTHPMCCITQSGIVHACASFLSLRRCCKGAWSKNCPNKAASLPFGARVHQGQKKSGKNHESSGSFCTFRCCQRLQCTWKGSTSRKKVISQCFFSLLLTIPMQAIFPWRSGRQSSDRMRPAVCYQSAGFISFSRKMLWMTFSNSCPTPPTLTHWRASIRYGCTWKRMILTRPNCHVFAGVFV